MDFHSIQLLINNSNETILIDDNNNYLHILYKKHFLQKDKYECKLYHGTTLINSNIITFNELQKIIKKYNYGYFDEIRYDLINNVFTPY